VRIGFQQSDIGKPVEQQELGGSLERVGNGSVFGRPLGVRRYKAYTMPDIPAPTMIIFLFRFFDWAIVDGRVRKRNAFGGKQAA
jgi:hypothetical protein